MLANLCGSGVNQERLASKRSGNKRYFIGTDPVHSYIQPNHTFISDTNRAKLFVTSMPGNL